MGRNFKASVQYDDFRGSAAADRADDVTLVTYFKDKGYIGQNEQVLAIEFWSGENHGGPAETLSVTVTVANLHGYETLPNFLADPNRPPLRSINVDMSAGEFFGYFKRFHVVLTHKGYEDELAGNEYVAEDFYPQDG